MIADVLHVGPVRRVERMEQRVGAAVELERRDVEPVAQLDVEHRRRLDPPAGEEQVGVAVPGEDVGAHHLEQPARRQVIADVGIADSRGNAAGAGDRRQQGRLGDAEPEPELETARGTQLLGHELNRIGVVANAVAHGIVEVDGPGNVVAGAAMRLGEGPDGGVVALNARRRDQIAIRRVVGLGRDGDVCGEVRHGFLPEKARHYATAIRRR